MEQRKMDPGLIAFYEQNLQGRTRQEIYEHLMSCGPEGSADAMRVQSTRGFLVSVAEGLYAMGRYPEAYNLYAIGADFCDSKVSQLHRGSMLLEGKGITADPVAAFYWLDKAAANGILEGSALCARILEGQVQRGSFFCRLLTEAVPVPVAGAHRTMNLGVFLDLLIHGCIYGAGEIYKDPERAEYWQAHRAEQMDKYGCQ